jgi:hypothetical protein
MTRYGEHFSCIFCSFWLLPLKGLCSLHSPISSLGHWFFGSLVFWAPCIFWLLVLFLMYSWQRFSLTLWVAFQFKVFLLLCRSFLILCSPICQSFLLAGEPFEFYWWIIAYAYCFQHFSWSFLH